MARHTLYARQFEFLFIYLYCLPDHVARKNQFSITFWKFSSLILKTYNIPILMYRNLFTFVSSRSLILRTKTVPAYIKREKCRLDNVVEICVYYFIWRVWHINLPYADTLNSKFNSKYNFRPFNIRALVSKIYRPLCAYCSHSSTILNLMCCFDSSLVRYTITYSILKYGPSLIIIILIIAAAPT